MIDAGIRKGTIQAMVSDATEPTANVPAFSRNCTAYEFFLLCHHIHILRPTPMPHTHKQTNKQNPQPAISTGIITNAPQCFEDVCAVRCGVYSLDCVMKYTGSSANVVDDDPMCFWSI